jgi:hypothetical protein
VADYNANIKVSADTRQAESQLTKLQASLDKLSDVSTKINLQNAQQQFNKLGTTLRGIGERGALGAITLGAGKAAASIGGLGAKFGLLGAAAASAGATVNTALGGVPGVITDILAQVGHIPNAFGLAAVAAMAFAPQVLKASGAAVGLGAAIDKAIGKQTTEKIASAVDSIGRLNIEIKATKASFEALVAGSTLNQLNEHLKEAVKESGAFHSSTEEAVIAAEQLVVVQKEQRREQKAITDLIREAQGLQPKDVRDTEVARRVALLKSREIQQQKDLQLQNQINAELAEYERLATEVANQTRQWATNLERIARSSKAGVLGNQSQIQARLQEFRQNRSSADIAREQSAAMAARDRRLAGGQYSLSQVPVRGELLPGGRTETASSQYRAMLNEQARIRQAASTALERSERSLIGLQAQTLRTEKDITAAKLQQQSVDERSIQLIREQNKLLMEQYRVEQRAATGVLDPASLRADRMRRVEQGRENQRRSRERTENVIIGGAFPMLFGGGLGTVIGGAAGGLIPGNPMLSVATSALGAVLDQFAAQATELGKTLQDPIKNFDALKEASLLASGNQERYIQKLIESGKVAEAQAAIQAELFKKVSTQGVADLQNLGAASTKLSRAWAEFNLQLQTAIAGPMAGLLSWLAGIVNISNEVSRKNAATESFLTALSKNPKQYQAYLRESSAMAAANGGRVNEAAVQALRERYMPGGVPTGTNLSAASQETVQLEKAKTSELKAQVDLAAKQLSLAGVDININREGYSVRAKQVALQEYENRLLEIKNSFIGKAFDAERNTLMIREANLNYAAKLNNIDAQVRESAARAAKKAADDAARIAEQALQSRVKLTQELYQAEKASYDIAAQNAEIFTGPVSGLKQRIADTENVQYLDFMILSLEKQQALIEAQKLGTASLVNDVYDRRLENLNQQYAVQKAQNQLEINRINLQRQQTVVDQQRGRDTQLRGIGRDTERLSLEATLIPGSPRLEKELQLLQQRNRTYDELAPTYERIADLQRQIASNSLTDEDLAIAQTSLSQEQAHLTQLQEELQLRSQLEQLLLRQNQLMQQYGNLVVNELSTAMSSAITAVVTGTGTVQEAFATMFQNIGKAFIDMATQMIAQALVMKVLGIFTGGITGGGGGGSGLGGVSTAGVPSYALPSGKGFFAFAEGGFVTGPTRALVGEGGEPEYVIPASKMRGAMSRYASGTRGSAVIPAGGDGSEPGAPGAGGTATLDVRYTVERINSVDYVTADQFQAGLRQAATQGAERGQQLALRRLQQSPSTRRRVGI